VTHYTFSQLYANHVLNVPLPTGETIGYCRECGGPVSTPSTAWYGDSWADEGLIPYPASPYICPACKALSKGSRTRVNMLPPYGSVLVVTPDWTCPTPDLLRHCHPIDGKEGGVGTRARVYQYALSFKDALANYRSYPTPFGIVIGAGGKGEKYFARAVPLNYSHGEILYVYLAPGYTTATIRPERILDAARDAEPRIPDALLINGKPASKTKARALFYQFIAKIAKERGLTESEHFVLRGLLHKYDPGRKNDK